MTNKYQRNIQEKWDYIQSVVGTEDIPEIGGIIRCQYNGLQLKLLEKEGLINPKEKHNEGPSMEQIMKLVDMFGLDIVFEGYLVIPSRSDCRISIDTLIIKENREDELERSGIIDEPLKHVDSYRECSCKLNGKIASYYWWD